jgi:hypothetical protein
MSEDNKFDVFTCPHCGGTVIVDHGQLNCHIFRHGVLKTNGQQVPPHTVKAECDRLAEQNLIFGCGKPFQVTRQSDGSLAAVACGYI